MKIISRGKVENTACFQIIVLSYADGAQEDRRGPLVRPTRSG